MALFSSEHPQVQFLALALAPALNFPWMSDTRKVLRPTGQEKCSESARPAEKLFRAVFPFRPGFAQRYIFLSLRARPGNKLKAALVGDEFLVVEIDFGRIHMCVSLDHEHDRDQ